VLLDPPTGTLTLRWKACNPAGMSGTSYIIKRRIVAAATLRPGETEFAFLGVSGKKEFVDDTLVAGAGQRAVHRAGQRADSSGPVSPIFTVNFGRLPDGARTASVSATAGREGIHVPADAASDRAVVDAIINRKAHGNGRRATTRV
jgi:hypothetical protein